MDEAFLRPFADPSAAQTVLRHLSERYREEFERFSPRLIAALGAAADPDRALICLERLAEARGPILFAELERNPRLLEILFTLFSASQFLTEILLRNPQAFNLLLNRATLIGRKTIDQFQAEAEAAARMEETAIGQLDALRRYQHAELLRIGASDLLDLYDLKTVVSQLSRLANGLIRACLSFASQQTGIPANHIAVLSLGKLGGRELNYSSDIDLLFVTREEPESVLPLAEKLIEALGKNTAEGFLYRVDMRLRPWGRDGPLVSHVDAHLRYFQEHARLWEKQALLKARSIAGDIALGESLLERLRPLLYNVPPEEVRASIFTMKQRTEQFLQQKGSEWGEVKLGVGSIRDIEFVVQSLQLIHGGNHPEIRTRATLKGIRLLQAAGFLSPAEGGVLTDGYIFLRTIEHYLQIMDYRQTHTLPSNPTAIALLARRLGFEGPQAGEYFVARYQQHCQAIRAIFLHHLGNSAEENTPNAAPTSDDENEVRQHLARMDASYAEAFTRAEIQHHAQLAGQLGPERLAVVEASAIEHGQWRVTIVAYDYPGELSLICGLMFVHGLNILEGKAFTYEPAAQTDSPPGRLPRRRPRPASGPEGAAPDPRRKIVDVFTVKPVHSEDLSPSFWERYRDDLEILLRQMSLGLRREAMGELAKRVGSAFQSVQGVQSPLLPIHIEMDNELSSQYTVLRIEATDTIGFLYELTNALALYRIYIARVIVRSVGRRVHDILYVTDTEGRKITDPERQRELRAAILLIKHFTHLLPNSSNPEAALLHFREFLAQLFESPRWPDELTSLEQPQVLTNLARLLGVSEFLWDDFLRMQYANLFPLIKDLSALETAKPRSQLQAELEAALQAVHAGPQRPREDAPWRQVINDFKDREMFRIDMRHILGHTREFDEFSEELTDLAEVIVNAVYHLAAEDWRSVHGTPLTEAGAISQMAVCALGKCGGRELGFASDIELMFIYSADGKTSGPERIPSSEFHEKVVQTFLQAIRAKRKGVFEIDLQLRPYGKAGSLAVSLEAFKRYYAPDGPAWDYERQALVKLRPIAGDQELGRQIAALRDDFVYTGTPFNVAAMRAMRERQVRHLVAGGTFNAKFSPGGLVDIEYLVQALQITYGAENPSVRHTNLRQAMKALHEAGILSEEDYTRLRKAHTFMRWLIDALRVVHGNAADVSLPPYDSEEFAFLARRLLYGNDTARLREDIVRYAAEVREINNRLLA